MAARFLIVNADDFGISEGVNLGIAEAHEAGILTSTSLMASMPAFDHAVGMTKRYPGLGVGVHLNLTSGTPLLPASEVATLVDRTGAFLPGPRQVARLSLGRVDPREVEAELNAQVERALRVGVRVSHLDSHHHLHAHPAVQETVVRIARRHGVRGLRAGRELGVGGACSHAGMLVGRAGAALESPRERYLKAVILSLLNRSLASRARRAALAATDHFRGLLLGLAFSAEDLQAELARLPAGSIELMCHPGHPDEALRSRTSYAAGRERELAALLHPGTREVIERAEVKLGSYSDLPDWSPA